MRTSNLLITLLALALAVVGGVAAFAAATGNESADDHPGARGPHDNETNETPENHTAPHPHNETDEKARHDELEQARHDAIESFRENRSAAIKDYLAALNATRTSFLENKTKVIDDCRAQHNATKDNETERGAFGHCVQDGLKPLIEKAHAEIKAAQDALREKLLSFRGHALGKFFHDRDFINVRHGHHG